MSEVLSMLFFVLIFPGTLFLFFISTIAEYFDRKLHARLQNRVGPPWFQPVADFIKLLGKEDIVPRNADRRMFKLMPVFALVSTITAFLYIPPFSKQAPFVFEGDLIIIVYLLTIPTFTYFLGGWYSTSLYAMIGSARTLFQLFAYEIPLFLAVLAPALLANTWSISGISAFYAQHPSYWPLNIIAFAVSLIALQGKLERIPFDIPEAETEIVAGMFTEYSGRLLAFFRLAVDIEMVVGAALISALFLPFWNGYGALATFAIAILKIFFIITILCVIRTILARVKINQMIDFCWKYLVPIAFVQIILNLIIKEVFLI
ncbi:MAG: complex I subunit 1 family protein [Elusimicrobiota bacterium]